MKITNFNKPKNRETGRYTNTWISWNKQYCQDLSNKITSLYDYIVWNYPEYVILNTPTSLTGDNQNTGNGFTDFQPYESLILKEKEERLPCDYYYEDDNVTIDNETRSLFFAYRLNFHQGFYNSSANGDGYIALPYEASISGTDVKTYTYPSTDTKNHLKGKTFALYPFPSGYLCLLNKQPTGEIGENNRKLWDISNYIIIPVGNGGMYTFRWSNIDLVATFYKNVFANFSNSILINFAQNSRYQIFGESRKLSSASINIPNLYQSKDETTQKDIIKYSFKDYNNNPWTGEISLITMVTNAEGTEKIIADISYGFARGNAVNNKLVERVDIIPHSSITLDNKIVSY